MHFAPPWFKNILTRKCAEKFIFKEKKIQVPKLREYDKSICFDKNKIKMCSYKYVGNFQQQLFVRVKGPFWNNSIKILMNRTELNSFQNRPHAFWLILYQTKAKNWNHWINFLGIFVVAKRINAWYQTTGTWYTLIRLISAEILGNNVICFVASSLASHFEESRHKHALVFATTQFSQSFSTKSVIKSS